MGQKTSGLIQTLLVIAPNWVGDQVMAAGFFWGLRQTYPVARILVQCRTYVADLQYRHWVDEVITEHAQVPCADCAITLPRAFSSAWTLFRSRAPRRRGYAGEGRSPLLTEVLEPPSSARRRAATLVDLARIAQVEHRSRQYFRLIPPVFPECAPSASAFSYDHWQKEGLPGFDPDLAWPQARALDPPKDPYWVLAPGAVASSRRWDLNHFVQMSQTVARATGWTGLIVGGAAEQALAQELCRRGFNLRDQTAPGPVSRLWRILREARFTLANESGLAHLAALCGSPVAVVCGAANFYETGPQGSRPVRILHSPIDCWPCVQNLCHLSGSAHRACLNRIRPEAVWEMISRELIPGQC